MESLDNKKKLQTCMQKPTFKIMQTRKLDFNVYTIIYDTYIVSAKLTRLLVTFAVHMHGNMSLTLIIGK